jgi:hypothetical protein
MVKLCCFENIDCGVSDFRFGRYFCHPTVALRWKLALQCHNSEPGEKCVVPAPWVRVGRAQGVSAEACFSAAPDPMPQQPSAISLWAERRGCTVTD